MGSETIHTVIETVRRELISLADEKTLTTAQHFFKEKIQFHGVKVPVVNNISNQLLPLIEHRTKAEVLVICEELWKSGYLEESFIACNWSYAIRRHYEPRDFLYFERWIRNYVNNWASCDTLCNHTVGEFLTRYPEFQGNLKVFALSDNRWVRRAAAVSLIIPARNGMFHETVFEIARLLLTDSDDLVQKGYGWMLKAASQHNPESVFRFVIEKKTTMPRTALRYAIEKMPEEWKKQAMMK